ncbi:MAG: DUF3788 family protein [Christensenellaceae bacterium]
MFAALDEWLARTYRTERNRFSLREQLWLGIAHRKKKKLMCYIFAEEGAFTVMMRLTDKQFETAYPRLRDYAREYIDRKYPCGDGGWIHYRVTDREQLADAETLLALKCL